MIIMSDMSLPVLDSWMFLDVIGCYWFVHVVPQLGSRKKNTWPTILVITLKLQVLSFPILSQTQLSTRSVVEFKDVQTNFIHHRTSHILNAFLYLILLDYIGLFRRMPMGHRIPSHYTSAGVFNISLWGMGSCVNLSSLHLLASAIGGFHQECPIQSSIGGWELQCCHRHLPWAVGDAGPIPSATFTVAPCHALKRTSQHWHARFRLKILKTPEATQSTQSSHLRLKCSKSVSWIPWCIMQPSTAASGDKPGSCCSRCGWGRCGRRGPHCQRYAKTRFEHSWAAGKRTSQRQLWQITLSIYLSIHPSIHPSIHLSIYPSIYPFIYLSIYLSIHPSIHPSIHLCIFLYICMYI